MDSVRRLEGKQLWKVDRGYVQIAEVGKRLVHYKFLRNPEQRVAAMKLAHREEVLSYLERNKAELIVPVGEPASTADRCGS